MFFFFFFLVWAADEGCLEAGAGTTGRLEEPPLEAYGSAGILKNRVGLLPNPIPMVTLDDDIAKK